MQGDRPVYFMLKPDSDLARRIDAFRHAQGLTGGYARDRLHSTVQPLWDSRHIPAATIDRTIASMARFRCDPFAILFNRFNGNSLRCTAGRAFGEFRQKLQHHLRLSDIPFPDYSADPHITLAYGRTAGAHRTIAPLLFHARRLLLIESVHGHGHVELAAWPLEPRQLSLFD
jgi:RNA 2',3'-cyclic 3'-phosphodiesterase